MNAFCSKEHTRMEIVPESRETSTSNSLTSISSLLFSSVFGNETPLRDDDDEELNDRGEIPSLSRKRKRESDSSEISEISSKSPKAWDENYDDSNPVQVIVAILLRLRTPAYPSEICQTLSNKKGFSWKKKFKRKFGPFLNFIRNHPETFVVSGDTSPKISLFMGFIPTSVLDTSPLESEQSSVAMKCQFGELVCVRRDDGSYGGWRTELLVEEITGKTEVKFLLCHYCGGVLRDACLFMKAGKQELACSLCVPRSTCKQIAQINRENVNVKQVYCPITGCAWINELSWLLHHLEECELLPVLCPLGCEDEKGEVNRVERKAVESHKTYCPMRAIWCDYCSLEVISCKMNSHYEFCELFPISCPNECEDLVVLRRRDLPNHLSQECPLQEIECPYSQYGCAVKLLRRDMILHEKKYIRIHLNLTTNTLRNVQHKVSQLEEENKELRTNKMEIQSLSAMMSCLVPKWSLKWKICSIKELILLKTRTYTDPFYVGMYKFRSCIEWDYAQDDIAYFLYIFKGEWDDTLKWPLRYKYTAELINQTDARDNFKRASKVSVEKLEECPECFQKPTTAHNRGYGWRNFITKTEILQEKYCKDGSITINISVEQILYA